MSFAARLLARARGAGTFVRPRPRPWGEGLPPVAPPLEAQDAPEPLAPRASDTPTPPVGGERRDPAPDPESSPKLDARPAPGPPRRPPRDATEQPPSSARARPPRAEPQPVATSTRTGPSARLHAVEPRDAEVIERVLVDSRPRDGAREEPVREPDRAPTVRPRVSTAPAAPGQPARSPIEPQPAPQPVVRITIGRIEVRAERENTPRPARPARPEPGRLTLEEYARQRSRGER